MDLIFFRHGKAAPRSVRHAGRDRERPLTEEGEQKTTEVAKGLRRLELKFDVILTSPYLRAQRTAEIAADILQCEEKLEISAHLTPDGDPEQLVSELLRRQRAVETVLLVGHEPYFSQLVSLLTAGDQRLRLTLRKAGICKLSTTSLRFGQCASLEWLMTPRHLALLGEG